MREVAVIRRLRCRLVPLRRGGSCSTAASSCFLASQALCVADRDIFRVVEVSGGMCEGGGRCNLDHVAKAYVTRAAAVPVSVSYQLDRSPSAFLSSWSTDEIRFALLCDDRFGRRLGMIHWLYFEQDKKKSLRVCGSSSRLGL